MMSFIALPSRRHHTIAFSVIVLAMSILLLSGCIQRQQIIQGNIITEEEVSELKLGMSKIQVQYVLGSPSIINPMQQDRWEYVYLVRDRKSKVAIRKGYLLFNENQLVEINLDDYFIDETN